MESYQVIETQLKAYGDANKGIFEEFNHIMLFSKIIFTHILGRNKVLIGPKFFLQT
jgi:hypothetical protein